MYLANHIHQYNIITTSKVHITVYATLYTAKSKESTYQYTFLLRKIDCKFISNFKVRRRRRFQTNSVSCLSNNKHINTTS